MKVVRVFGEKFVPFLIAFGAALGAAGCGHCDMIEKLRENISGIETQLQNALATREPGVRISWKDACKKISYHAASLGAKSREFIKDIDGNDADDVRARSLLNVAIRFEDQAALFCTRVYNTDLNTMDDVVTSYGRDLAKFVENQIGAKELLVYGNDCKASEVRGFLAPGWSQTPSKKTGQRKRFGKAFAGRTASIESSSAQAKPYSGPKVGSFSTPEAAPAVSANSSISAGEASPPTDEVGSVPTEESTTGGEIPLPVESTESAPPEASAPPAPVVARAVAKKKVVSTWKSAPTPAEENGGGTTPSR